MHAQERAMQHWPLDLSIPAGGIDVAEAQSIWLTLQTFLSELGEDPEQVSPEVAGSANHHSLTQHGCHILGSIALCRNQLMGVCLESMNG